MIVKFLPNNYEDFPSLLKLIYTAMKLGVLPGGS